MLKLCKQNRIRARNRLLPKLRGEDGFRGAKMELEYFIGFDHNIVVLTMNNGSKYHIKVDNKEYLKMKKNKVLVNFVNYLNDWEKISFKEYEEIKSQLINGGVSKIEI